MKTLLFLMIAQAAVMVKPQGNTKVMPYPIGGKIPCSWIQNECWTTSPSTTAPTTTTPPPTTSSTTLPPLANSYLETKGFAVTDGQGSRPLRTEGGTWRQGEYGGRPLKFSDKVTKGTRICSKAGDVLLANNDGQLGTVTPLNQAIIRLPKQDLKVGQLVYAGYAGGDTPNAQWRVMVGGRTSSQWNNLPWCPSVGCITTDGTVQLKREALAPVDFIHGNVRLTLTCCANAYGCSEQNTFGQLVPNDSSLYVTRADNQASVMRGGRNQVDARSPFYMSMMDTGGGTEWCKECGDPRIGTFENEDIAWNTSFLAKFSTMAGIDPPELPPTVTVIPGQLGRDQYCFSLVRIDKRWAAPTAMSWRTECVRTTPGVNGVEISLPEDQFFKWPVPGGGSSIRQTRYWVCNGSRDHWGMWIGTLENPTDKIRFTSDSQMPERATCPVDGRANIPILTIGNPFYYPNKWFAGMGGIEAGWSQVIPIPWREGGQKDDGRRRVAARTGCTGDCFHCAGGVGTTGLSEPDWASAGSDLILDGNICWMPLPHYYANVHNGASIWLKPMSGTDQYAVPGLLIDWNGVQVLDTNAKYPLSAPRVRGLDNAPGSTWYNPISWF